MARKQKSYLALTSRDRALLLSLWKWKGATTAALAEEFFGGAFSDAAYRRLKKLARFGYVDRAPVLDAGGYVWMLAANGFKQLLTALPELKEAGYRSEALDHDYLCTALQRGPWLCGPPDGMEHVSEQELRRLHQEHLPEWVPVSAVHRPDGYSRLRLLGESITVAFEVELNRKHRADYELVAHFYQHMPAIYRVIWLTASQADARWFQAKIRAATPDDHLMHLFVTVPDFLTHCWNATILFGHEAGHPLHHVLSRGLSPTPLPGDSPSILERQKRPYRSLIYRTSQRAPICDRMAFSAIRHSSQPTTSFIHPTSGSSIPNLSEPKPYGGKSL